MSYGTVDIKNSKLLQSKKVRKLLRGGVGVTTLLGWEFTKLKSGKFKLVIGANSKKPVEVKISEANEPELFAMLEAAYRAQEE